MARAKPISIDFLIAHPPTAPTLPLIGGTSAPPGGSSFTKLHLIPLCTEGADGRNWPKAEATAARRRGRFLRCTRRAAPTIQPAIGAAEPWRPVLKVLRSRGEAGRSAVDAE
jgi:hypothetical protein